MSVFTKAIEALHTRGLNKGSFVTYDTNGRAVADGPVCTMGACGLVERGYPGFPCHETLVLMEKVLKKKHDQYSITQWNDAQSRTVNDVINFLLDCEAEREETAEDVAREPNAWAFAYNDIADNYMPEAD